MAARLGRHGAFDAVLALSARHAYGTPALLSLLLERARTAPWELAAGQPAELTWPELAAELVREKIYWAHTHEVPYAAGTRCAEFLEGLDGRLKVVVVRSRRRRRGSPLSISGRSVLPTSSSSPARLPALPSDPDPCDVSIVSPLASKALPPWSSHASAAHLGQRSSLRLARACSRVR